MILTLSTTPHIKQKKSQTSKTPDLADLYTIMSFIYRNLGDDAASAIYSEKSRTIHEKMPPH